MYRKDMDSFSSVITALGGPAVVGPAIDAEADTVRKMAARRSVRSKYWPALIRLARVKKVAGVTTANLTSIAAIEARRHQVAKAAEKAAKKGRAA